MKENNTMGYVVGVVVVLGLLGLSYWWWSGKGADPAPVATQETATTTAPAVKPVAREDRTTSDVASVIASIPDVSRFAAVFASTGVAASLSASGTYTVFVPTNGAYSLLTPGTIEGMNAAARKRLVQYHVISGRAIDVDEVDTGTVVALSKDTLNFEIRDTDNSVLVNSSFIVKQYKAKNGIVYVISGVLVPPEKPVN